jgi:hypothetical protein
VDLEVAVEGLLVGTTRRLALGVEPLCEVADRVVEALGQGGEVLLVGLDQGGVGLRCQPVGQVERAVRQGGHGSSG